MKQNRKILQALQKEKENTKQLVITSVFIAMGVDSFVTGLLLAFGLDQQATTLLILGAILSFIAIVYFFLSNINKLDKNIEFTGFAIYKHETKELFPVSRYQISEDMVRYLHAACVENKALKILWDSEPIDEFEMVGGESSERALAISTHSGALFIELIEYCVIEQLSFHLSAYFNNSNLKAVEELSRKDIPDILLDNRFLKLFSEDMQNRELFVGNPDRKNHVNEEVVSAYHSSGAMYKKFDLILPTKSKVKRINKNQIVIETNMFSLTISCLFGGINTNLPRNFIKRYLGIQGYQQSPVYKFNVEISMKFKVRSFLLPNKWNYYNWADDFIEKIDHYLSKDTYFQKINWETVNTLLRCNDVLFSNSTEKNSINNSEGLGSPNK